MLLPALVFGLVVLVVFGTYWWTVVRPERAAEAVVRRRLVKPKVLGSTGPALVMDIERLSNVPALNSLLTSQAQLVAPVHKLIQQSGAKTTVGVVILSSALSGAVALLIGQWLSGTIWVGVVLGSAAAWVPGIVLQIRRQRRIARFEELFPEAIDLLSRALRAGHAFTTALGMVADELPEPIAGEFRLLYDRQNYGLPLDDAMRDFAERVSLLDAKFFVTVVLTQRESGGNLSEVLDNLASVIRERFVVKRQVRTRSAHGRVTGWVLSTMPPALVAVLVVISPNYLRPLVDDPMGLRLIVIGVILQIVGTLIIRRIVRIDF